jgi:hypothetical protein
VIDTAQRKGRSEERIEALQELTADGVPLVGVDVSEAFLEGVQLPGANWPAPIWRPPIFATACWREAISSMRR